MAELVRNTPPVPNPLRKRLIVLMVLVGILLVSGLVFLIFKDSFSRVNSFVSNNQIPQAQAAEAVSTTQDFINALDKKDLTKANLLKSPAAKSEKPITETSIEGYFGEKLVFTSCRLVEEQNYRASTTKVGKANYDIIYIKFNCQFSDGWPVEVTFDMRREAKEGSLWLFGDATVRDVGVSGDTI